MVVKITKVENSLKEKMRKIEDIKIGETFEVDGIPYMKLAKGIRYSFSNDADDINAINMLTGDCAMMSGKAYIIDVDISFKREMETPTEQSGQFNEKFIR